MIPRDIFENLDDVISSQLITCMNCKANATKVVDERQDSNSLATIDLVGHEVHAPTFVGANGL